MGDKRKRKKEDAPDPGLLGSGLAANAGRKIADRDDQIKRQMEKSTGKYKNRKKRDGS